MQGEHRLAVLINSLPGIVFSCDNDPEWSMNFLSNGCFKVTGYQSQELAGQHRSVSYNSICHPEDLPFLLETIDRAIALKEPYEVEYRIYTKDGQEKWLWEQGHGIYAETGNLLGLEGFITDITQLKQAEKALQEQEAFLRLLLDNIPLTIFWKDVHSVYLGCNQVFADSLGIRVGDIVGKTDYDLPYTSATIEHIRQQDRSIIASGKPALGIFEQHEKSDATQRWAKVNKIPIADAQGQVMGVLGTIEDITNRKQAEESIRVQLAAIEAATDGIAVLNAKREYLYLNKAYVRLFGFNTAAELIGQPWQEYPPSEAERIEQALNSTLHHNGHWQGETIGKRHDDSTFPQEISLTQLENGGVICVCRDISDRKMAESALQQKEELLRLVLDNIPQTIFWKDRNSVYLGCNRRWTEMVGLENPAQIVGRTDFELPFQEENMEWYVQCDRQVIASNTPILRLLENHQQTNGEQTWREINKLPIHDLDDRVIGILTTIEDVTDRQQAEQALRQAEQKYRSIFENAVEGIFQTTLTGRYITANQMLAKIYGYESPVELVATLTDIEHQLYVDSQRREEFIQLVQENDAVWGFESQVYRKDGSITWISENARTVRNQQGQLLGYEGTVEDITTRKYAEAELLKRDTLLQGASEATSYLVTDINHDAAIAKALATLGEAAGVDRVYIYQNHAHPITSEPAMSMRYEWVQEGVSSSIQQPHWQNQPYSAFGLNRWYEVLSAGKSVCGVTRHLPPSEQAILKLDNILSILLVPILIDNHFWGYIGFDDCGTERCWSKNEESILMAMAASIGGALKRQQAEATIRYQAFHDLLTGLPNRMLFNDRLPLALANAHRNGVMLAVMFLDLDRFKTINDTLGHAIGDQLLQSVAHRLLTCLREGDTISRWGGDEFTLLLPQISCAEDAAKTAQRMIESLKPAFYLNGHELYISSSIGIALYPTDGDDAQTLLKNADAALYRVKEQGRNGYQIYTPTINSKATELLALASSLHHALERNQFVVHYQPQVNTNTWEVTRMEALVRWHHPELGVISPRVFIPLAEETGLIVPIGEWVLRTACRQNKRWQQAGLMPLRMAVNLSTYQFKQPHLVETITQILAETELNPCHLELEITETTAMQNVEFTNCMLQELQAQGVHISMDDFGTGYSSLSYLKKFPLNTIKIDQSFMQELTTDVNDAAIVGAIVALGRGLNLSVVAEGVETKAQFEHLRSLNCIEMQGYLFSKPMTPEEATQFLHQHCIIPLSTVLEDNQSTKNAISIEKLVDSDPKTDKPKVTSR